MHVFIVSIIGQSLMHLLLGTLIWLSTEKGSRLRRITIDVIITLYIIFLGGWCFRGLLGYETLANMLVILNSYYIFLVIWLSYTLIPILSIFILEWTKVLQKEKAKYYRRITLITLIPITIILCIIGHHNTTHPIVNEYDIVLDHKGPEKDLKIAFVSDVHIGEFIREKQIKQMVGMIKAEDPDYIFFGGDMLDYYFSFIEKQPAITKMLKELLPDRGKVFYVLGNHEYYADTAKKIEWMKEIGTLMINDAVQIDDSLYLVTRDDATQDPRPPLQQIMQKVPQGSTTILLEHQPATTKESQENGIDLALHGHTHNGQFIPFNWVVALRFPKSFGWYKEGDTQYVVSSGYGIAGSTFRIGTRSEIVIINLKLRNQSH